VYRTVGRPRVYPDASRFTVSLSDSDMRYVDMMCNIMNVSRAEFFRKLLSASRAEATTTGEKA
jgi:hypothetical protein